MCWNPKYSYYCKYNSRKHKWKILQFTNIATGIKNFADCQIGGPKIEEDSAMAKLTAQYISTAHI